MASASPRRRRSGSAARGRDLQQDLTGLVGHVSGTARIARARARTLIARVPASLHATRAGAHGTTSALQKLPDTTLRWLAASSVGLGAGFYLARAPRLAVAAGVAPALIMGAAMVLRPIEPALPAAARR